MRSYTLLASIGAALVASSCAFLLDFDELQDHPGADASLGGSAGAAGSSGSSGSAGAGGTAGDAGTDAPVSECSGAVDCDDQDPFTTDTCEKEVCKYTANGKLVADGFTVDQSVPYARRVTLAAAGNTFFVSTHQANLFGTTIYATHLSAFAADATPAQVPTGVPVASLFPLPDGGSSESALSAMGMLADASGVHAYFATSPSFGKAKVWYAKFGGQLQVLSAPKELSTNYSGINPRRYPKAQKIGNDVIGYWIGSQGKIIVQGPTKSIGAFDEKAEFVAPVDTAAGDHSYYLRSADDTAFHYKFGSAGKGIPDCNISPDATNWGPIAATSPVPGLVLVAYSSRNILGSSVAELRLLVCDGDNCDPADTCDNDAKVANGRNPAIDSVRTSASLKSGTRVRVASVIPVADGTTTNMALIVSFFDPGSAGDSQGTYAINVVSDQKGSGGVTADYPAVAILDDKVVVAWIDGANGAEMVHLRRYKLAPP